MSIRLVGDGFQNRLASLITLMRSSKCLDEVVEVDSHQAKRGDCGCVYVYICIYIYVYIYIYIYIYMCMYIKIELLHAFPLPLSLSLPQHVLNILFICHFIICYWLSLQAVIKYIYGGVKHRLGERLKRQARPGHRKQFWNYEIN